MNTDDMISVLKGKISEVDPRKAFTGIALGTTLSLAGAALIYGDLEQFNESIKNTMNAGVRSAMLYLPDMISDNIYFIGSLKAIATNVDKEILAGVGILSAGALYNIIKKDGISDTGASIYNAIIDSIDNLGIDKKRAKRGLFYTGALVLIGAAIATSGCLDFGSDDNTVTTSTDHIPTHNPIEHLPVEPETHIDNNITEPVIEPVAEPVETAWYDGKDYLSEGTIGADINLFNENIEGVIYESDKTNGGLIYHYDVFSKTDELLIFQHQEFTPSNLRLDLDLSPNQYRELNAQYGTLVSATMETIDNDPTHAGMDQVAVHYVGTGGEEGFITDADGTHGIIYYIKKGMYLNLL